MPHDAFDRSSDDGRLARVALTALAFLVVGGLILVPLVQVFALAFGDGLSAYWQRLAGDADTLHSILLTLAIAPIAVAINAAFGIAAAWAIARSRFRGRTLLITVIDLPFSVSPVIVGLMFVLLFGLQGPFGGWLREHGLRIVFAWPGLVLVTAFVTIPFVARELLPVLELNGREDELAAATLGATGCQTFWRVTVPNIKWALLYGIVLCSARALGEFGAAYVVSGHVAGETDTMPLRVERLFQEYDTTGSFAVASTLALMTLVALALKTALETKVDKPRGAAAPALREPV